MALKHLGQGRIVEEQILGLSRLVDGFPCERRSRGIVQDDSTVLEQVDFASLFDPGLFDQSVQIFRAQGHVVGTGDPDFIQGSRGFHNYGEHIAVQRGSQWLQ